MPNNQPRFYAVGGNIIKLCHGGVKCNMATSSDKYSTLYKINLNIQTNNRTESMYKDGLAVSEELRSLSYKFKVPIVSAV